MSKQLTLNEDELITAQLALSHTINYIKQNLPPENWIYVDLKRLEELRVKVDTALK